MIWVSSLLKIYYFFYLFFIFLSFFRNKLFLHRIELVFLLPVPPLLPFHRSSSSSSSIPHPLRLPSHFPFPLSLRCSSCSLLFLLLLMLLFNLPFHFPLPSMLFFQYLKLLLLLLFLLLSPWVTRRAGCPSWSINNTLLNIPEPDLRCNKYLVNFCTREWKERMIAAEEDVVKRVKKVKEKQWGDKVWEWEREREEEKNWYR